MKNFLLIDDHAVTRMGLKILITELFPGASVCEASNGQEAEMLFKEKVFDLCTLDLNMPNTDSFDFLRKVSIKYKGLKILVVSMNNEDIYAVNALKSGAMGFVSKASGFETIKEAIIKIVNNQKYISERVVSILLGEESYDTNNNPFYRLSERELEVAKLLILGDSTKEISNKMHLEVSTISSHKNKIFSKLQVNNTIELYELYRLMNQ
jgi:two-component system, NarL family, invasion response regulator UvrY